jgi:3-oxoacyl-(acyl-carrier-protein) synthase
MLGAAGGTEAAMSILSLMEGWIPASLRADPIDEKIRVRVNEKRLDGPVRRVVSNSFAFGGNNISVVLGAPQ